MNSLRRSVLLVAVAVATVLGITVSPAQADFSATAALPTSGVGTVTVQPPTGLSTAGTVCTANGMELHLGWSKSRTARTAGYRVRAYTFFGLVNVPIGTVGAGQTSFVANLGSNSLGYSFTVTTVTDYGWTAESAQTGTIRC